MSFDTLMTHTITTQRYSANGVGVHQSYQTYLQNVPCLIQPVSARYAKEINAVFGRTYNLFVALGTDLQTSDKITDQDGKVYQISGSLKRNYGANAHLTFIVTEQVTSGPDQ